ncbi:MAG: stage II sporulation protein P [Bacillota bacterium]|jgi:stage II sporulation protein P
MVVLACGLFLTPLIYPTISAYSAVLASQQSETSPLEALLQAGDELWKQVLQSALPKHIFGVSAAEQSNAWAMAIARLLQRLKLSRPRDMLAMAIPVLRHLPQRDPIEEIELLPASDPPIPPLVPMLEDEVSAQASAHGLLRTPQILIYQTHNTESYQPTSGKSHVYGDPEQTVVKVGARLAEELIDRGAAVTHSRADNVRNAFSYSYSQSLQTISAELEKNPSLEYVFDIHRDAVPRSVTTTVIQGQSVARVYFVIGSNQKLGHPNWRKNLEFAQALHNKLEELYPGLSRGILVRENTRFNQHVRDNAVLIEIGGDKNTMDEALRTTRFLADGIIAVIADQQKAER